MELTGRDEFKPQHEKRDRINRDINEYNRTHIDTINAELQKISDLDRDYVQKIGQLKNDALSMEAARRADQRLHPLSKIPVRKPTGPAR
ncbi:hypothetical protein PAPYR_3721 [Paratrimastix pyriformis]|uniref:Uncharacterized protein n=1 Tax=Paratrimastix pyriformis TaxID=342808 RepID=A0ABQ8UNH5_9EUKA|nr:hypothetical protein PAPYR_3721 [Paratrimastix pyriformis]